MNHLSSPKAEKKKNIWRGSHSDFQQPWDMTKQLEGISQILETAQKPASVICDLNVWLVTLLSQPDKQWSWKVTVPLWANAYTDSRAGKWCEMKALRGSLSRLQQLIAVSGIRGPRFRQFKETASGPGFSLVSTLECRLWYHQDRYLMR